MASLFPAHAETLAFAKAMAEADLLDDWQYYFEKPYKWEPEYNLWVAFGRPTIDEQKGDNYNGFVNEVGSMYLAGL